ncbi:uncharacterized protein [Palaemon carinicauda]|uniref:uncharacterized protein n=1 Tax=Palaemon carinicauda TaxID=392227 RepID=UPI0035B596DF
MGRCLLIQSKLPKLLWPYAIMTAAYIRNRCFSDHLKQTPFFALTGIMPDLSNMRVFGSDCYVYNRDKKKLDDRCSKGIFVGYDKGSPAYLVYFPETDNVVIILVWVDDLIVAASNKQLLYNVKQMLKDRFKMKDLGKLSHFLGIDFKQCDGTIKMNQRRYVCKILEKFDMSNCKPRHTPSEQKIECSGETLTDCIYREAVGSLIYVMACTRPDLCWIVTKLSQYLSNPIHDHWVAVKPVFRYLNGTLDYELCFSKCENEMLHIVGYSYADWASSPDDRRSTGGYCFSLSERGPLVS